MLNWLLQAVIGNAAYAILVLAGGAMLAILKAKGSRWLGPATYGLGGCALMAVALTAFVVMVGLPKNQTPTTPENVESNIRTWLDHFGLSSRTHPDQESYFGLDVTLTNGRPLNIRRLKEHDHYVLLVSKLALAPEHRTLFAKLPEKMKDRFIDELSVEIARERIGYGILLSKTDGNGVVSLSRRVPITASLSEDSFMDSVDQIDSAITDSRSTIRLLLSRLSQEDSLARR